MIILLNVVVSFFHCISPHRSSLLSSQLVFATIRMHSGIHCSLSVSNATHSMQCRIHHNYGCGFMCCIHATYSDPCIFYWNVSIYRMWDICDIQETLSVINIHRSVLDYLSYIYVISRYPWCIFRKAYTCMHIHIMYSIGIIMICSTISVSSLYVCSVLCMSSHHYLPMDHVISGTILCLEATISSRLVLIICVLTPSILNGFL